MVNLNLWNLTKQINSAEKPSGIEKAVSVAKYPISAAAGLVWAHRHARNAAYDVLVEADPKLATELTEHKDRLKKLAGPSFRKEVAAEHRTFRKAVSDSLKGNGYEKPWHLPEGLGNLQRWDTLLAFATAASITLGVIAATTENKSLMEKITHKDRNAKAERG